MSGLPFHYVGTAGRGQVIFDDKRLPDAYVGDGTAREDNELFIEIAGVFASLPVGMQELLQPFTLRPADSRSTWNATGKSASSSKTFDRKKKLDAPAPATCSSVASNSWVSKRSASRPLRVWASCRGEPGFDTESGALVDRTLALLEKIYPPMTALMGEPRTNTDGGDEAIDFYIVDSGSYVHRRSDVPRPAGAVTVSDAAAGASGKGSSAYIVMQRDLLYTSKFKGVLMHEFFHVLQFAHNAEFSVRAVAGRADARERFWFTEASSHWAEAYFDRTIPGLEGERIAYQDVHRLFAQYVLPQFESLNKAAGDAHAYAAYIWPYFVEQETGGPAFMRSIWSALDAVSTWEQADKAIDAAYPFAANFKRFALRNLNTEFLPGDPLPEARRYIDLDRAQFLDDKKEPPYSRGTLVAEQDFNQDLDLKPLSARYIRLQVGGTTINKVVVDMGALQPASEVDVEALIRTSDGWVSQPIAIGPGKVTFCSDKGPSTASVKGSFEEIILVVSNHSATPGADVSGVLKVQPKLKPCETVWEGTITQTFRGAFANTTTTVTSTVNATFEFDEVESEASDHPVFKLRSGSFTYRMDGRNPSFPCRSFSVASGALPLEPYQPSVPAGTSAGLVTYLDSTKFSGGGISIVPVTTTENCNTDHIDIVTVDPNGTMVWWNDGVDGIHGDVSTDGSSIRYMRTTTNGTPENSVTYDIRLDRKKEGD